MSNLSKLHDEALDYENAITIDTELLSDLRVKMYDEQDKSVLREVVPVLNAILSDAEKYKDWIMEQLEADLKGEKIE